MSSQYSIVLQKSLTKLFKRVSRLCCSHNREKYQKNKILFAGIFDLKYFI